MQIQVEEPSITAIVKMVVYIILLPNPNKGQFTISGSISAPEGKKIQVEVINMLGQIIYKDAILIEDNNINKQVQLSNNVPNGVYIVRIKNDEATKTVRFTLNR